MDGVHDMGGMHGFGRATWPGADAVFHEEWEARAFALSTVTGLERLRTNNGRADREQVPPAAYLAAGYYERWLGSTERGLYEAGTIAPGDVEAMMARLRAGEEPPRRAGPGAGGARRARARRRGAAARGDGARFAAGARVRVRRQRPAGHTRSPRYVRGVVGEVERVQCADRLPDDGAHPLEAVYAVGFRSEDVFGPGEEPPFRILMDLWESYLEDA